MNINSIRKDFSILNTDSKNAKNIIYFDNACMSLKPRQVVDKINEYYNEYPACAERSYHKLGKRATEEYESVRGVVKKFINAKSEKEIIFTKNTTESINLVAKSFKFSNHTVIQTDKEHNSNLIPWHLTVKANNLNRKFISTNNGFDMQKFEEHLNNIKKSGQKPFVAINHTSNLDGTSNPVKEIIKLTHDFNGLVLVDAAQSIPHQKIDIKKLDVDFLAFSGHKMLGPTGTGVLYGKKELLENLNPFITGGSTVKDSTYEGMEFEDIPNRFEAGLQDFAGFIGLGEAINYLSKYIDDIHDHDIKLNKIITDGLTDHVKILGTQDPKTRSGIFSFVPTSNKDVHEVAIMLDSYANIMIRSGRHCVHSWFNANKIDGSDRASFYLYNTEEEAKIFVEKTKEVLKIK